MREILFRAKRYSGEWVYGYYAHQYEDERPDNEFIGGF